MRKDVDRVSTDAYDLKKHIEDTEARNVDVGAAIRTHEIRIKEKDEDLYLCKKDIDGQIGTN